MNLRPVVVVFKNLWESFLLPFRAAWAIITTSYDALCWFFWGLKHIGMAAVAVLSCLIYFAINTYGLVSSVSSWLWNVITSPLPLLYDFLLAFVDWLSQVIWWFIIMPWKTFSAVIGFFLRITGIAALWDPIRPFWMNIGYIVVCFLAPFLLFFGFALFMRLLCLLLLSLGNAISAAIGNMSNRYQRVRDSEFLAIAWNRYQAVRYAIERSIPSPIVCWILFCAFVLVVGRLTHDTPAQTPSSARYLLSRPVTDEDYYRRGLWPGTNERIIAIGREPRYRDPATFTETETVWEVEMKTQMVWAGTTTKTEKVTKTLERTLTSVVRLVETTTQIVTKTQPVVDGPLGTVAAGGLGDGWVLAGEDGAVDRDGVAGECGSSCPVCEQEHC